MNFLFSLFSRLYPFLLRVPRPSEARGRGILSETRDIHIPSRISVGSAVKLVVQQAAEPCLHVSVRNPDHLSRVSTEIRGGVLMIAFAGDPKRLRGQMNVFENADVTVGISTPRLRFISANGSSSVVLNGVRSDALQIKACDAASVYAQGSVGELTVCATDAATIDCRSLSAADVIACADDAADVLVIANEAIHASAASAGSISVGGNPAKRHVEKSAAASIDFVGR